MVSCCGITLPPLEAEDADDEHQPSCEVIDQEHVITFQHSMTKDHYISFAVYCTNNRFDFVKLYPEGDAQASFFCRGHGAFFWYCNHHGLFVKKFYLYFYALVDLLNKIEMFYL